MIRKFRKIKGEKMKKIVAFLIAVFLISGCSIQSPKNAKADAPTFTLTAVPSPTTTSIPTLAPTPTPISIDQKNASKMSVVKTIGNGALLDAYFSPDQTLLIVDFSHAIVVMEAQTLKSICRIESVDVLGPSAITKDNRTLVAGINENLIKNQPKPGAMLTWDIESCTIKHEEKTLSEYPYFFRNLGEQGILSFAYKPDDQEMNSVGTVIEYRDPVTLQVLKSVDTTSDGVVDFSGQANRLSISQPGSVKVFNFSGDPVTDFSSPLFTAQTENYSANTFTEEQYVAFSPDGKNIAISGTLSDFNDTNGSPVQIWDIEKKELVYDQNKFDPNSYVKFLTDTLLAIVSQDKFQLLDLNYSEISYTEYFEDSLANQEDANWNGLIYKAVILQIQNSENYLLILDTPKSVILQLRSSYSNHAIKSVIIPSLGYDFLSGYPAYGDLQKIDEEFCNEGCIDFGSINQFQHANSTSGFVIPREIQAIGDMDKQVEISKDSRYLAINYRMQGKPSFVLLGKNGNTPLIQEEIDHSTWAYPFTPAVSSNGNYFSLATILEENENLPKNYIGKESGRIQTYSTKDFSLLSEIIIPKAVSDIKVTDNGLLYVTYLLPNTGFSIWDIQSGNQLFHSFPWLTDSKIVMSKKNDHIFLYSGEERSWFTINNYNSRLIYVLQPK